MLYNFLAPLANDFAILNLFRYITFRCGGAVFTALLISFVFGPRIIRGLKKWQQHGQPIREDGPETHLISKKGTPTMGGLIILLSVFVSTLLWADLYNQYVWIVLLITLGFGLIGLADDYMKVAKKNPKGLPGKLKLLLQGALSLAACLWIENIAPAGYSSHLALPFFKNILIDLGWLYPVFGILVIVGSSNAVNLTDGLDGLAIVPIAIAAACFALISYLVGNLVFANYLQIHHVPGTGELAVLLSSIVGAGLGFLWFNAQPAKVFMGDVGSLSLGGAIGSASVITKHELVLFIIGGLFVMEAVSVILQVGSYKLRGGKRIFRMAPIHHHFEKLGWPESTVVARFWILAVIFALLGLATLKLR